MPAEAVGEGPAGLPAPRVAERAGHSVEVLLRVYAKCLDDGKDIANTRIAAALRMLDATPRAPGQMGAAPLRPSHVYPTTSGRRRLLVASSCLASVGPERAWSAQRTFRSCPWKSS